MKFEELKIRIQNGDTVLLKCSPKFVIKQMNLFDGLTYNNDIILMANLFYSDNYTENHNPVQGDIIGGSIVFSPKLNPKMPIADSDYICTYRGNGEYSQMSMMVFNDEDCAEIEVLNLCDGADCGVAKAE